jgi:hypothetical protein
MRMPSVASLLFLSLFCVAGTAAAQDSKESNRGPIIPFLEGTDVFWTPRVGQPASTNDNRFDKLFLFRLEADIFPHLVVAQSFTDVLDLDKQLSKAQETDAAGAPKFREWTYSISGTPAVRLRMSGERSAPVRSPSFMPRGNFQLLWVRGVKDCSTKPDSVRCRPEAEVTGRTAPAAATAATKAAETALLRIRRVSVWEGHLIVGHHSNGQDGCLSTAQHLEGAPGNEECVPDVPLTPGTVNTKDGSFSTNYFRLGVNYSRNWLDKNLYADLEMRLKVELEQHPKAWMDPVIADIYGRTRLNLGAAVARRGVRGCPKRLEGSAALTLNPGAADFADSPSGFLQVSCFAAPNGGWGMFARFYGGQDYYNSHFFENIKRLQVGLTFNQSAFFRFRRSSQS